MCLQTNDDIEKHLQHHIKNHDALSQETKRLKSMLGVIVSYGTLKHFKPFVNKHLENKGNTKIEVIVAVMRKMVTIAQAVLKTQTAYIPKKYTH